MAGNYRTSGMIGMLRPVSAAGMFLAALALPGCASTSLPIASVNSTNQDLTQGYQVASGDKLRVTVFDEPNLTGEYEIGVDGELSLPLIEAIPAAGVTTSKMSELIATKLKEGGYVLAPRVSVEIILHRPFFILGEVVKPGEYSYSGDLTLDQAVAKAGGYTARAEKKAITLRRQQWASARRVKLDSTPLKIAPGDTITIQEAFF